MISPDIVPKSVVILHARSCKIIISCKNFLVHEKGPAAGSLDHQFVTIPGHSNSCINARKYYDDVILIGLDKSSILSLPDPFLPIPSN